ncbi:phage tail protein [Clostridium merdae]|uniref:phage tail protein n=1 Tax=Clostridium merdae TaxID=1958780 RepID=UPI000A2699B5|nr:hypothetical protein [Clostridium merdae]
MAIDNNPRDEEKEYKKRAQSLTNAQKNLSTETQALSKAYEQNNQSQKSLSLQNKTYAKQIEQQKKNIDGLKDGLVVSSKIYGENNEKIQNWQKTIKDATADVNSLEHKNESSSKALNKADKSTGASLDVTNDSQDVGQSSNDTNKKTGKKSFVSVMKDIASASKDIAVEFIESAASVKAEKSQFEQTFGDISNEAEAAVQRVGISTGILDTRLNSTASSIYDFAHSSGGTATESMGFMEEALQAAADSAAYYNNSLEDASVTLLSFIKGNYENDTALGLSATETDRNAKATEQFGKKFDDLSEIQKQQTLLKMVTDSQKLSGVMGQASRDADSWDNVQGNLNETWRQFQAKIGTPLLENLIPILQGLTSGFQDWMASIDVDKITEQVTGLFTIIKDNGATIASVLATALVSFGTFQTVLLAAKVPALAMLAVTEAQNAVLAIQAVRALGVKGAMELFSGTTKGASVAQWLLNAAMNANPIALIIAAVAALVAGIIVLWNTNESFRNAVIGVWENIKQVICDVVTNIINFFTVTIPEAFNLLKERLSGLSEWWFGLWESVKQIFTAVCFAIFSFVQEQIPQVIESFLSWFFELPTNIGNALEAAFTTFLDFGASILGWITSELSDIMQGIYGCFGLLPEQIQIYLQTVLTNIIIWGMSFYTSASTAVTNTVTSIWTWFSQLSLQIQTILTTIITNVILWGVNLFTSATTAATNTVTSIGTLFSQLPMQIWTFFTDVVNKIILWAQNMVTTATTELPMFVGTVAGIIGELPGRMLEIGTNIVEGIWNGIWGSMDWLQGKIRGFANNIIDGFKRTLKIHSPSRLFADEIGTNIALGIGVGFEDSLRVVASNMASAVSELIPQMDLSVPSTQSAISTVAGSSGSMAPVINYNAVYNSPSAPTPAEVNRINRLNAQRLALITRR